MYIWLTFGIIIGVIGGVLLMRVRYRAVFDNPLVGDSEEGEELRAEAQASVEARIDRRKERIMARALELGSITNDNVEELFCISDRTARRYLNQLEAEGALRQEGEGRGMRYLLTK